MYLQGKVIVILSPQPWKSLYISKQHYARVLAQKNTVFFIPAPGHGLNLNLQISQPIPGMDLNLVKYNVPLPPRTRFYFPAIYKKLVSFTLSGILKKITPAIDLCIDFGCYQQYKSVEWVGAKKTVFFPVDDNENLQPHNRGAEYVFSVSKNICEKFHRAGKECHFINHGLSGEFEAEALRKLENIQPWKKGEKFRVAYSGNVFIPFLDIPVLQKIIEDNREIEFHFYGGTQYNSQNQAHAGWDKFLHESENVIIHGLVSPAELAEALKQMDAFILCYKPDYKNYHAENSHKIFEYLSTGKTLFSTYLSIYQGSKLIEMTPKDQNGDLVELFHKNISRLDQLNELPLQVERIRLALDNTYEKQVDRIDGIINQGT